MKFSFLNLATFIFLGLICARCTNTASNLQANNPDKKDSLSEKDKHLLSHVQHFGDGQMVTKASKAVISEEEIAQLQHGDILLRRGYGAVSDFIADFLEETYPVTHCGFVLRYPDNKVYILHIISDLDSNGVRTESLQTYIDQSQLNTLAAVRLKTTQANREAVLGEIYKLKAADMKFDMGFNDHESTEMYCAEMSRHVIQNILKKDVLPDRAQKMGIDVTRMSNFFDPKNFEIIFNQLPVK